VRDPRNAIKQKRRAKHQEWNHVWLCYFNAHGVDNDPKNNAGDPKRKDIGLKPLEPWIRVRHDANASLDEQPAGAGQKTANDRIGQEPNDSTEFEIPQSQQKQSREQGSADDQQGDRGELLRRQAAEGGDHAGRNDSQHGAGRILLKGDGAWIRTETGHQCTEAGITKNEKAQGPRDLVRELPRIHQCGEGDNKNDFQEIDEKGGEETVPERAE